MPYLNEIETKVLDKKTAMDYKHHLLKLMIDMENSQNEFVPSCLKNEKLTEKSFVKRYGTIDSLINDCFDKHSVIVGSFHTTKNNILIAYLFVNVFEDGGDMRSAITNLYVDPYYRRIRVGKLLMNMTIEQIKNHQDKPTSIQIGVLTENKVALKIYNELGFKPYHQAMYLEL